MSICVTTTCPHGQRSFVWLGNGPDEAGRFPWVHAAPAGPSLLLVCGALPWATAQEAGEVCACGHEHREHLPGRGVPAGRDGRCGACRCGRFRHRPEDLARARGGGAA